MNGVICRESSLLLPTIGFKRDAIEISFNIDPNEVNDNLEFQMEDILTEAIDEWSFAATSAMRRRSAEIRERQLTAPEREAFRVAKHREWGRFLDNRVVEFIQRRIAEKIPSRQVLGSRWVLTWKSAKDYTDKPVATTTVKIHGQDVPILHPENSTITPPVQDVKAEAMD